MQIEDKDINYTFSRHKGVGKISFSFNEKEIIRILGEPDEVETEQNGDDIDIHLYYNFLGIYPSIYYEKEIFDRTEVSVRKLIIGGKSIETLEKNELIKYIQEYCIAHNLYSIFIIKVIYDEELVNFPELGLGVWFKNDVVTDISVDSGVTMLNECIVLENEIKHATKFLKPFSDYSVCMKYSPAIGLGNILFTSGEDDIIDTLGTPDERCIDSDLGKNSSVVYLLYYSLGIFIAIYYEKELFYRLTISVDDLSLNGIPFSSLSKEDLIVFIEEYCDHNQLSPKYRRTFNEKVNEEQYIFEELGLTIWFEDSYITDICVQKAEI